MTIRRTLAAIARSRALPAYAVILGVQALGAVYFASDAIADGMAPSSSGLGFEGAMEFLVAFALIAGVVSGALYIRKMLTEARRREDALSVAKGALADLMIVRFEQWRLSAAEAEVALFALKGCSVADIARLRNSAAGTVRSQLSQVYAKAGVTSQAMLISLFFEELLEGGTQPGPAPAVRLKA